MELLDVLNIKYDTMSEVNKTPFVVLMVLAAVTMFPINVFAVPAFVFSIMAYKTSSEDIIKANRLRKYGWIALSIVWIVVIAIAAYVVIDTKMHQ